MCLVNLGVTRRRRYNELDGDQWRGCAILPGACMNDCAAEGDSVIGIHPLIVVANTQPDRAPDELRSDVRES